MPFVVLGPPPHSATTGRTATDHHTATVGGDINLADLAARAHADLSDAPANAHHTPAAEATQAAMEAETAEATRVPPDLVRHSPGVAKVWVHWEQVGAHSIKSSYNMTSVTDGGAAGDTDHLWDVDFSSASYTMVGMSEEGRIQSAATSPGQAATGATTHNFDNAGNAEDMNELTLVAFGDQ